MYVILICRPVLRPAHLLSRSSPALRQRLVSDKERTQANSIIQYYGQFSALGPIYDFVPADAAFGWRNVFIITGVIGIAVAVPLYITMLKIWKKRLIIIAGANRENQAYPRIAGRNPFLLLIFTYINCWMLFWELRYGYPWLSILPAIPIQ